MDCLEYTTQNTSRNKGSHLTLDERGAIQHLKRLGYSNRDVAREIGCCPATIGNELKRGTAIRKSHRGRPPEYLAKRGQAVYRINKSKPRKKHKIQSCGPFLAWISEQVKVKKWSLDVCVGYARKNHLFPEEQMVCTKTLYNELWNHNLPLTLFDTPLCLKRRRNKHHVCIRGRVRGRTIDERPSFPKDEIGHWEGDTVIGLKSGKESAVLTLLEKASGNYIAMKIAGRNTDAVEKAMESLKAEYGNAFGQIFKSITVDNGPEFEHFSEIERLGSKIYFAHPYSAWERPQNERTNGLFRGYVPKGKSIDRYTADEILQFADELNARPRKKLGYLSPEDLFEAFLDDIYKIS